MAEKVKKYGIQIDTNAPKTLDGLNKQLSEMNAQLQQVEVGSQAFNDLNASMKTVEKEIGSINSAMNDMPLEEKARGIADLSGAIVGGFSLASQSIGLFSEQSQEGFDKASKQALQYIQALGSIEAIAKGVSGDSIKLFKSLQTGFQQSAIASKLFGTTAKAAIVGTGIGALVVGVGLLIANWEAVSKAVGKFIDSVPFLKSIKDTITGIVDQVGSLGNLLDAVGGFFKGLFTEGASAVEEFNKALEASKAEDKLLAESDALKEVNKEREREIELLEAAGTSEEKIFEKKKEIQASIIADFEKRIALVGKLSKEENEAYEDAKHNLEKLKAQEKKYYASKEKAAKDAYDKAKELREREAKEAAEKAKAEAEKRAQEEFEAAKTIRDIKIQNITDTRKREEEAARASYADDLENFKGNEDQKAEYFEQRTIQLYEDLDKIKRDSDEKDIASKLKLLEKTPVWAVKIKVDENGMDVIEAGSSEMLNLINQITAAIYDMDNGPDVFGDEFQKKIEHINERLKTMGQQLNRVSKETFEVGELTEKVSTNQLSAWERIIMSAENYRREIAKSREEIKESGHAYELFVEDAENGLNNLMTNLDSIAGIAHGLAERRIQDLEESLGFVNEELSEADERLNDQIDKRTELDNLLKESSGERRLAIEEEIEKNKAAQAIEKKNIAELTKVKEANEKKIAAEKNRQAKIQRNMDMANAVINTALAVVKALPVIPLAIAAGVAGALQIAAIAAQPLPKFADGGNVGEGVRAQGLLTPALGGIDSTGERTSYAVQLHADEYVVNRKVATSPEGQKHISALESMKKKNMAAGGSVGSAPSIPSGNENMLQALKNSNFVVSVVEFEGVSQSLVQTRDTASI